MPKEWYLKTWFISLLFAAGFFTMGISILLGIVLLINQHKFLADMENKYNTIDDANKYYSNKKAEADDYYNEKKAKADEEVEILNKSIAELKEEQKLLNKEIKLLQKEIVIESVNLAQYDNISSEECKNKLDILKIRQKELIESEKAIKITSSDTKKVLNNNIKQLLRCFNSECEIIISNINPRNVDAARSKIMKSYEILNKIFSTDGVSIEPVFLETKLEELNLVYAYQLKKEQEREHQKAIREQMLEEEKVRREIEREKQKIAKEETQFKNEISKLMRYMQKSNNEVEIQLYIDKIKELEEKLALLEKDKENILQREQNTRAGFVYVISNIGSFGENVYKIGMTRRLEPMDRIKELGDASVPFGFDVHAMIFSEDAPALENILHQTFKKYEINKVNPRKEFFKVDLEEIKKIVKENYNSTVEFINVAEAYEYRESIRINQSEKQIV